MQRRGRQAALAGHAAQRQQLEPIPGEMEEEAQ